MQEQWTVCVTSTKWDEECGRAVVPISGVNTTDEPMVFRGGQRIADATKLHSSTVSNLTEHQGTEGAHKGLYTSSCDEGTTTDGMSTEVDHAPGDWRRGQSWKQILDATRHGTRDREFRAWRGRMEERIKIGEEEGQEGAVTEAVKEMYLRLIFAYKEVVSDNPKKPGTIPGIYHQIIFDRPKSYQSQRWCRGGSHIAEDHGKKRS